MAHTKFAYYRLPVPAARAISEFLLKVTTTDTVIPREWRDEAETCRLVLSGMTVVDPNRNALRIGKE